MPIVLHDDQHRKGTAGTMQHTVDIAAPTRPMTQMTKSQKYSKMKEDMKPRSVRDPIANILGIFICY